MANLALISELLELQISPIKSVYLFKKKHFVKNNLVNLSRKL